MKTLSNKTALRSKIIYFLILGFAFLGCKKYFDPPDVFETQTVVNVKKRKVLLVTIDGLNGQDMKTIAAPNITAMLQHSKYTWDAMGDYIISDGTAWKNIMAGVTVSKHGIKDNTFDLPEEGIGAEHDDIEVWPSFVERLQGTGKIKRAVAITSWPALSEKIFIYADQSVLAKNDKDVRDSALNKLSTNNNDLVIVDFNEALKAGIDYGFSPNVSQFKNAVLKADEYIGDMLKAIKDRKNYKDEEWLIIVTSTNGGTNNGYGLAENTERERKIFTVYYNDSFTGQELTAPPAIDGLKFSANAITATLEGSEAEMYNFRSTGDYTIEFRLRVYAFGTLNSTIFFKSESPANSKPGWWFIHNGSDGSWRFVVRRGPTGGSNKTLTSKDLGAAGPPLMTINRWYRLTAKIYTESSKRYMVIYQDGVRASNPMEITGEDIQTTAALYAGFMSGYGNLTNQSISDIRIWNTALPDSKIAENACSTEVAASDPYYGNLIGYWPGNDGYGDIYKNFSPLAVGKDLKLSGSYKWEALVMPNCGADLPLLNSQVSLTNSDIYTQIFYWFGALVDDKWNVDGKVWLSAFELEFIKETR